MATTKGLLKINPNCFDYFQELYNKYPPNVFIYGGVATNRDFTPKKKKISCVFFLKKNKNKKHKQQ